VRGCRDKAALSHDEAFLKQFVPDYQTVKEEPNTFSSIWLKRV